MTLYIDSTNFDAVTYVLAGDKVIKRVFKANPHQSYVVFSYLEKFLKSSKVKTSEIKKIVVNKGPGSYTGTRIGVTHAMALGFAWDVPVKALDNKKFNLLLSGTPKPSQTK